MKFSDIPDFLPLPFAVAGGRAVIPVASQIGVPGMVGRASLTDGFPPLTRTPLAAGGAPPDGLDMNGILYEISSWTRWQGAGATAAYDAAISAEIGGYPAGALLAKAVGVGLWLCLLDDNTSDPGAGGAGWVSVLPVSSASASSGPLIPNDAGLVLIDAAGGNITRTLPLAASALGLPITYSLVRQDASGNTVTVVRSGGDTVEGGTSITLGVGERVILTSDGISAWFAVAGTPGASTVPTVQMQTFTSSVLATVPAGVTQARVRAVGGGGGGGACSATGGGQVSAAGGGNGGAYAEGVFAVTPGTTVSIVVGTGGAGGPAPGGAGSGGLTSSFNGVMFAPGGQGASGVVANPPPLTQQGGVASAVGSGGSINGGETPGGPAIAGTVANVQGGNGGDGPWGGGASSASNAAGRPGFAPGAGGGGASGSQGNPARAGGAGANGVVVVEWLA